MMLYLANNSRPEIAFAVHQCARFTHCVRASHEDAILGICRYLKETRFDGNGKPQGMLFRPDKELRLDCYADADFAGLWTAEDAHEPIPVKS